MTTHALIDDLSTDGIRLTLCKGQIEVSGTREAVGANVVRRIRSKKPEIVRFLANELLERATAAVPGVTADDLRANLDIEDWQDLDLIITYERLKGLAGCIRSRRSVLAGQAPIGWTANQLP